MIPMSEPVEIPLTRTANAHDLLIEIANLGIEVPARIDMGIVVKRGAHNVGPRLKWRSLDERPASTQVPECGAIGCVAGWSLVKTGRTHKNTNLGGNTREAQNLLGLSTMQASELFVPASIMFFGSDYKGYGTPEHAKQVYDHIMTFVAKNRKQLLLTPITVVRDGDER